MEKKHLMRYLSKINNGRFFKASWSSEVPVKKEYENRYVVTKVTISTVRKGIQYTNTKAYKDKLFKRMSIECAGNDFLTPTEFEKKYGNGNSLPWGRWLVPNLLIEHTNKNGEYNIYLRLYSTINKPESRYYLNGKEISKEGLYNMGIVREGYWNKKGIEDGIFTVNIANILSIG